MSLECGCDTGMYVSVDEKDFTAPGTIICPECGTLVQPGDTYIRIWSWETVYEPEHIDLWWTDGMDVHKGVRELCYDCGGMAHSILERGFCYYFDELRADVRTLASLERHGA